MKKMKMSIMRWLGIQDRMLQLELEISDLQSKLENFESDLEGFGNDLDDKVAHWDVDDRIRESIQDIDISDYEYGIENIIDSWASMNIDGYVSDGIHRELENLADSDTIRELIAEEVSNHPSLSEDSNSSSDNTTWDMNEIIQEVIEELVNRLK